MQIKFEENRKVYAAGKTEGSNIRDEKTIAKMEQASRFPIPEQLLSKPPDYWLYIDTLMHAMWNEDALYEELKDQEEYPLMQVPDNSSQSDTDVNLYGQDSDELREEEEIIAQ
jgi:hypothetical protein